MCSKEVKGVCIGIDPTFGGIKPSDEVSEMITRTIKQYESLGAKIIEISLPDQDELNALSNVITRSEAATIHRKWLKEKRMITRRK